MRDEDGGADGKLDFADVGHAAIGAMGLVGCVVAGIVFVLLSMAFSTMGQRLLANSHKEVVTAMLGKHLGMFRDRIEADFSGGLRISWSGARKDDEDGAGDGADNDDDAE